MQSPFSHAAVRQRRFRHAAAPVFAGLLAASLAACGGGGSTAAVPGPVAGGPTPGSPGVSIPSAIAGYWISTAAGDNTFDPTSGLIVGTNGASRSLALNSDASYDYKQYTIADGIFLYVHIVGSVAVNPANSQLTLTYTGGTVRQPGNAFTPTGSVTQPATFSYRTQISPVDGTNQFILTELSTDAGGNYRYADNGSGGVMTFIQCTAARCPSLAH